MDEIDQAAYEYTKSVDDGERVIVGVNRFTVEGDTEPEVFPIDPELQRAQVARVRQCREQRDHDAVRARLADVTAAARGTQNLLPPMKEALRSHATLGEVSDALRDVFGVHHAGR
jgi:methylmalonyl-CoA mutase N-terminal domain/subunit